jgi:hypothetical protein
MRQQMQNARCVKCKTSTDHINTQWRLKDATLQGLDLSAAAAAQHSVRLPPDEDIVLASMFFEMSWMREGTILCRLELSTDDRRSLYDLLRRRTAFLCVRHVLREIQHSNGVFIWCHAAILT